MLTPKVMKEVTSAEEIEYTERGTIIKNDVQNNASNGTNLAVVINYSTRIISQIRHAII